MPTIHIPPCLRRIKMNDKDSLNLIEEIKQLKETIVELNKNLKKYIDETDPDYIDWSESKLNKLNNIKEDENILGERIKKTKHFSACSNDTEIDNTTKELNEIFKQMIPIFKEWIKEHKKGDEWKNEQ